MKTTIIAACWVFIALLSFNIPVQAQQITPPAATGLYNPDATPLDTSSIPVLAHFEKSGAKLYYLGARSGIHGWLALQDGQIQIIYVTSDKQTVLLGGLFTAEGDNVSGVQLQRLVDTDPEFAAFAKGAKQQGDAIAKTGSAPNGTVGIAGNSAKASPMANKLPSVPLSPGERLVKDLLSSNNVVLGKNEKAEIIMIMDVNCGHCRATWRDLREAVKANRVQVRLVPITINSNSDSDRAGGRLLMAEDPLGAWDRYAGGDREALAGEPDGPHREAIFKNGATVERWQLQGTPYLIYRAKDGQIKIVKGQPERMADVLSDLVQ